MNISEKNILTREVLFEKTKYFWVKTLFSESVFIVRRGKVKDFDILCPAEYFRRECIDEGFFTITEGDFKNCYILKNSAKRINKPF